MLQLLCHFSFNNQKEDLFLLKGYAGTGKTTTISTFVNTLSLAGKKAVLLAPTGRAAKVISGYSKRQAYTIHKKIYFPKKNKAGGVDFTLQPNKHSNTVFIVDEIQSGMGRTGQWWAVNHNNFVPDLLITAKGFQK